MFVELGDSERDFILFQDRAILQCELINSTSVPQRPKKYVIHGTAHRGANGAAMPTDEDDQDDHFLFNHPERGGNFAAA